MRTKIIIMALLLVFGYAESLHAELNLGQKVLIDFGNNETFRGVSVSAPDENGNYWNSVSSGTYFTDLIDKANIATTIDMGFISGFGGATDSYNGPAGATDDGVLVSLPDTDIDSGALGDLGAKAAAFDFYLSSGIVINGLDPTKTYELTFFGSRKYETTDAVTEYGIYTDNQFTQLITSVNLTIGEGNANHNRDTVAKLRGITTDGSLYLRWIGTSGNDGYLNAMSIEVIPPPSGIMLIDFGKENVTDGDKTDSPDANGNYWNNSTDAARSVLDLADTANYGTGIGLSFLANPSANGIQNGGLLNPSTALLGDIGIADATEDYFYTTTSFSLKLTGLASNKAYNLSLFGTRWAESTRETTYTATGGNGPFSVDLQTSGTDIGNDGLYDGNDDTIVTITGVTPDVNNEITLNVAVKSGGYAYLGVMKVTEVAGPTSSGIDLRAYQASDGVYVEFTAYDVEMDGSILLALMDGAGNVVWNDTVQVAAGPVSVARFRVPGLDRGSLYNFKVRDEVGQWWSVDGVTVGSFDSEMTSATLTGITITFESLPERSYDIQWTPALGGIWQTVATVAAIAEETSVIVDYPDAAESVGFFRVQAE